ncbi:diguanylate cyclase [Magnetococcales bacterium HHB-1]
MQLQTKTTLLILGLITTMAVLVTITSLIAFRTFSLATAEEQVRVAAEIVRVTLTEAMINGSIKDRHTLLHRLAEVQGLKQARVIRGEAVQKQYGPGLKREQPQGTIEKKVLKEGKLWFKLMDEGDDPTFRGIIPFIAKSHGSPNCMTCHEVKTEQVLGAVVIDLSLGALRQQAIYTIASIVFIIAFFAFLLAWLARRMVMPFVQLTHNVQEVLSRAIGGDFSGKITQSGYDEAGMIALGLNKLMQHIDDSLREISRNVARLIRYGVEGNSNLLAATTEMVNWLVNVAKFKQSIEEDSTRQEVYGRIARILQCEFSAQSFSIYEVDVQRNQMIPVIVDGEFDQPCRWCDPQILSQADSCRARRTGHSIDSVATPQICGLFQDNIADDETPKEHICLPVIHSGSVGAVVQLVMPQNHGQLYQKFTPFIQVYLRESASVVEAKRLMDRLRESALRDALTGLHNRRFLEEYVKTLVAMVKRRKNRLSILMMDLDHFKEVNDTYGHDAGDMVLKKLAKTLEKQVRSSDLIIRFGGEEFMVILHETGEGSGQEVAEKIRYAVEHLRISIPGAVLRKTISIGLARFPTDSYDFWESVKYADLALYKAKSEGRNQVVIYSSDICAISTEEAPLLIEELTSDQNDVQKS